jgi:dienelactone hydrolase
MSLAFSANQISRRRAFAALVLLAAIVAAPAAAQTADPAAQSAPLIEQRLTFPLRLGAGATRDVELDAMLVRPRGAGPFPLAVITHGTSREVALRQKVKPDWFLAEARSFARRGWATAIVVRHGFGASTGSFDEGFGGCENPDFAHAGEVAAADLAGAVDYLREQSFVDRHRVLGIGQSTGGMAWLAAAARHVPGLVAVIDFAGGNGSAAPGVNCSETRLLSTIAGFGAKAQVPTLWIFAENDHYFGPDLAKRMAAAWRDAGGKAELHVVPPHGEDGHDLLLDAAAVPIWSPIVDPFLRAHGLPTWTVEQRLIDALQGPHREHFQRYLAAASEKAFALAEDGSWDWWVGGRASPEDAVRGAMEKCEEGGKRKCRPFAVNFAKPAAP